jgi:DNA replication initiation complex subunit (GINS family)
MENILTGEEKDFILEMMDFISDMPTMFEPLQRKMERKYRMDKNYFLELLSDLKAKCYDENEI